MAACIAGEFGVPLLSLCMIVKNEARDLGRCLESVRGVVDELIIVDMGSTDATVEIATQFGAKVAHFEWCNDFSAARNVSLAAATGDWALVLDADEELTAPDATTLRDKISGTQMAGFRVLVRNLTGGDGLSAFEDVRLTRLFRLGDGIRYEQPIHERIRPAIERSGGLVEAADILILHHGYATSTTQGGVNRVSRNLELLRVALERSPEDAYLRFQLGATLNAGGRHAEAEDALVAAVSDPKLDLDGGVRARAILAQLALRRNDVVSAAAHAAACLATDPENAVALYVAAYCAAAEGRLEQALPLLDRVLAHSALAASHRDTVAQLRALCASAKKKV